MLRTKRHRIVAVNMSEADFGGVFESAISLSPRLKRSHFYGTCCCSSPLRSLSLCLSVSDFYFFLLFFYFKFYLLCLLRGVEACVLSVFLRVQKRGTDPRLKRDVMFFVFRFLFSIFYFLIFIFVFDFCEKFIYYFLKNVNCSEY